MASAPTCRASAAVFGSAKAEARSPPLRKRLNNERTAWGSGLALLSVVIVPTVVLCVPTLISDAIFIAFGCAKLPEDFRLLQAQWVKMPVVSG